MRKHKVVPRAIFLDRDGVLNRVIVRGGRPHPPVRIEDFELTMTQLLVARAEGSEFPSGRDHQSADGSRDSDPRNGRGDALKIDRQFRRLTGSKFITPREDRAANTCRGRE